MKVLLVWVATFYKLKQAGYSTHMVGKWHEGFLPLHLRSRGFRALAFANGGLIPEKMRGTKTEGIIHIADWYATFCKLTGVDPSDSGPGKFPVDGLDVWPIISGESTKTPHDEIVLGFNFTSTGANVGAIIMEDYKLIVNPIAKINSVTL